MSPNYEIMKKILLVDDDPFILDIYSSQLKKEGYKIDVANNKIKALEKIINSYPDLLILDLSLDLKSQGPKDGLDILKEIRRNPKSKNLRVMVMSNYDENDYPELSSLNNLGVAKVFLKVNSSTEDVIRAVKEILN